MVTELAATTGRGSGDHGDDQDPDVGAGQDEHDLRGGDLLEAALGHTLHVLVACTQEAPLFAELHNQLEATGGARALATWCVGVGPGLSLAIERV